MELPLRSVAAGGGSTPLRSEETKSLIIAGRARLRSRSGRSIVSRSSCRRRFAIGRTIGWSRAAAADDPHPLRVRRGPLGGRKSVPQGAAERDLGTRPPGADAGGGGRDPRELAPPARRPGAAAPAPPTEGDRAPGRRADRLDPEPRSRGRPHPLPREPRAGRRHDLPVAVEPPGKPGGGNAPARCDDGDLQRTRPGALPRWAAAVARAEGPARG